MPTHSTVVSLESYRSVSDKPEQQTFGVKDGVDRQHQYLEAADLNDRTLSTYCYMNGLRRAVDLFNDPDENLAAAGLKDTLTSKRAYLAKHNLVASLLPQAARIEAAS